MDPMCIAMRLVAFDADAGAIEPARPRIVNHCVDFPAFSDHYQAQLYRGPTVSEVYRSCSRAIRIHGIGATAGVPLHRRRSAINHNVVYLTQMAFAVKVSHRYAT